MFPKLQSRRREALLSEADFEKVSGSVGASCFVDDFVSCWGKRGAYRLLLEPFFSLQRLLAFARSFHTFSCMLHRTDKLTN